MEVEFVNDELKHLAFEAESRSAFSQNIITAFRKRVQFIIAARDERDLYAMRSLHFKKLKGNREPQRSIRLNDQWRLILEIIPGDQGNTVRIINIEDYH
jgi:proteic killer suppression protein